MPSLKPESMDNMWKRKDSSTTLTPEYLAYSNAPQIISITAVFFAAAVLSVILRCYVRLNMLKVFGIDDYIILFSALCATATFACFNIEVHHGLGRHLTALYANFQAYEQFQKVLYFHSLIVMVGVSSVKISIAYSLLRLSTRTMYSRFLYGMIGFIIVFTIACAGTLIFQCFPVEAAWDYSLRPPPTGTGTANCYNLTIFRNLGLMNSTFNIITDALFATLPIPLIWKLQLNTRTKMSLIAVLSLGWFACAAAIVKAIQQWSVFEDADWTVHDSFNIWNFIEFTVGILAASLPPLKPLVNRFLETARAITSGGRTRGASGYKGPGSLGYHDMGDPSGKSIALQSIESRGDDGFEGSSRPYNVQITTQHTGLADKDAWELVHKDSDESILPFRQEPGPNGILMTKEVHVG